MYFFFLQLSFLLSFPVPSHLYSDAIQMLCFTSGPSAQQKVGRPSMKLFCRRQSTYAHSFIKSMKFCIYIPFMTPHFCLPLMKAETLGFDSAWCCLNKEENIETVSVCLFRVPRPPAPSQIYHCWGASSIVSAIIQHIHNDGTKLFLFFVSCALVL